MSQEIKLPTLPGPRDVEDLARRGICEGNCADHGGHRGPVCFTRVRKEVDDWGAWSYCATARGIAKQQGTIFDEMYRPFSDELVAEDAQSDILSGMLVKLLVGMSDEMNHALRRAADGLPLGPYIESILVKSAPIRKAARELGITFPPREKDGRGKYPRKIKD